MIKVPLTKGLFAVVDKKDEAFANQHNWFASVTNDGHIYAKRTLTFGTKRSSIYLHRELIGAQKGQIVDHVNGDTLDNRRVNLRIVSASENSANQRPKTNKKYSKHPGVSYLTSGSRAKRWTAAVHFEKKATRLGYFHTEQEAAKAYRDASLKIHKNHSYFSRGENKYGDFQKVDTKDGSLGTREGPRSPKRKPRSTMDGDC